MPSAIVVNYIIDFELAHNILSNDGRYRGVVIEYFVIEISDVLKYVSC